MVQFPSTAQIVDEAATKADMKTRFSNWLLATLQLPGAAAEVNHVIASGRVTPATAIIYLTSEGAATSDDLEGMEQTELLAGAIVFLRAANGHTITVKNNTPSNSAGRFVLADGADFVLDNSQKYLIVRNFGGYWSEVGRMGYGVTTPASTAAPGVAELATNAEALTGTDAARVITAAALAYVLGQKAYLDGTAIGSTVQGYDSATAKTNAQQAWTKPQRPTPSSVNIASAFDASAYAAIKHTMTASTPLTVAAPSNTPVEGDELYLYITGATGATLSWNVVYKASSTTALPSAPAAGKTASVCYRYDGTYWQIIGTRVDA